MVSGVNGGHTEVYLNPDTLTHISAADVVELEVSDCMLKATVEQPTAGVAKFPFDVN